MGEVRIEMIARGMGCGRDVPLPVRDGRRSARAVTRHWTMMELVRARVIGEVGSA